MKIKQRADRITIQMKFCNEPLQENTEKIVQNQRKEENKQKIKFKLN